MILAHSHVIKSLKQAPIGNKETLIESMAWVSAIRQQAITWSSVLNDLLLHIHC